MPSEPPAVTWPSSPSSRGARRMGVGTALMNAGEAWARDQGLPALSLDRVGHERAGSAHGAGLE